MFDNIEKVIRDGGILTIEEERYGSGLLLGFDFGGHFVDNSTEDRDATLAYYGTEITNAIVKAVAAGDMKAVSALNRLEQYAKQNSGFLFVKSGSLDNALQKLEDRAKTWNALPQEKQDALLLGFIAFEPK